MAGKRKNPVNPWAETEKYKELKKDMLDDLDARGLVGRQYVDKVEEYLNLWCWLQMLNEDVAVSYTHLWRLGLYTPFASMYNARITAL